jgi:hypothetical protein
MAQFQDEADLMVMMEIVRRRFGVQWRAPAPSCHHKDEEQE